jgi:hypothetical protein
MWYAWGTRGMHTEFWWESQKERDHLENTRRWEYNIKMELIKIKWGDIDWICLSQDRGQWKALVNTVINLRVP